MHEVNNKLTSNLMKFLPAKKIILLKKAEDDFTRKLIQKFKGHRGPEGRNGPEPRH